MYSNFHSTSHTPAGEAARIAAQEAQGHTLAEGQHYVVASSVVDELRSEAAAALFSLGAWIKPRKLARPNTPVQLPHGSAMQAANGGVGS